MYDMKITTKRKVIPNASLPIDLYLDQDDVDRIYEVWGRGVSKYGWDLPISLRGGEKSITVDMLKEIPKEELEKIYYKTRTERILSVVNKLG